MKTITLLYWFFISTALSAQAIDSIVIVQKIDSLINAARQLTSQRLFDDAILVNAEAQRITLEVFGQRHPLYASTLFNQGRIYSFKGELSNAIKLYEQSKELRAVVLGKNHIDYARNLINLGAVYQRLGESDKALTNYLGAKDVFEEKIGKNSLDYCLTLNNIGGVYNIIHDYARALQYLTESKEILEKMNKMYDTEYARVLEFTLLDIFEKCGRKPIFVLSNDMIINASPAPPQI